MYFGRQTAHISTNISIQNRIGVMTFLLFRGKRIQNVQDIIKCHFIFFQFSMSEVSRLVYFYFQENIQRNPLLAQKNSILFGQKGEKKYAVVSETQKEKPFQTEDREAGHPIYRFLQCDKVYLYQCYEFWGGLQYFLMQKQKSGFSLLFLIFLISTRQVAWQGYGNMSASNLTEIWTFINNNIGSHTSASSYDTFNTAFSDQLNTLWAPAWNIFTIKTTATYDTVLYGYAFNNHWMWFNDYQVNGIVLTFVIWKDYNCQGWKTVGKNGGSSGLTFMTTNFKTSTMSYDRSNLWQATKAFNHKFDSQPGAYSFVSSQDTFSDFYGRICVKNDNYFYSRKDAPGYWPFVMGYATFWGNLFIFQTR